ncbi:MAG: TetR/AcrR family transcriptional regulator [Bacteroidota bacterium]
MKILTASLALLNERGLASVSQRDISEAIGISPGNLTYHFKKKADIIEALYHQLVAKTEARIAEAEGTNNVLVFMYRTVGAIIEHFYEYRFIFNDFLHVMRDHAGIREHYGGLLQLRRQQFMLFFTALEAQGLIRPPAFDQEYERFYTRQAVLADFWFAHAVFHPEDGTVEQCRAMLTESLYPYLTEAGQGSYWAMLEEETVRGKAG